MGHRMNGCAVYIPTRKREHILPKVIRSFQPHRVPIIIVTDDQFVDAVERELEKADIDGVQILPTENDVGIGNARDIIVSDAFENEYRVHVQCDDDNRLMAGTDLKGMVQFARRRDVVGVGAWKSTYSLFTGKRAVTKAAKEKRPEAFLKVGGYGHMVFALNTSRAYELGGFMNINAHEDDELEMRSIIYGLPWYIYTACQAAPILNRYAPGGLSSHSTSRAKFEHDAHHELHHMYPEYISSPEKRMRISWAKMANDHLPVETRPLEDISAGERAWSWRHK